MAPGTGCHRTDCSRVCQAMMTKEDRSTLSFCLAEAKAQAQLLVDCRIAKVIRECNLVVHDLAQLARRNTHIAVWRGRAPACVLDLVKNDVIL